MLLLCKQISWFFNEAIERWRGWAAVLCYQIQFHRSSRRWCSQVCNRKIKNRLWNDSAPGSNFANFFKCHLRFLIELIFRSEKFVEKWGLGWRNPLRWGESLLTEKSCVTLAWANIPTVSIFCARESRTLHCYQKSFDVAKRVCQESTFDGNFAVSIVRLSKWRENSTNSKIFFCFFKTC